MRKYVVKLIAFVTIQLVIAGAVLAYRPISSKAYFWLLGDKHQIADKSPLPRLFLVGGSNVALGFDSKKLDESLGFHTVNLGVHIRLGLPYMLNEAGDLAKSGDVVVLCPEYPHFSQHMAGPELVDVLVYYRPQSVKYIELPDIKAVLDNGVLFLHTSTMAAVRRALGKSVEPGPPYVRQIDDYGDVTRHWTMPVPQDIGQRTPFRYDADYGRKVIARINEFVQEMRARDVKVFFCFPCYYRGQFENSLSDIRELEADLREQLAAPILCPPEEFTYPQNMMFDTDYHLNLQGVELRSGQLASCLKKALNGGASGRIASVQSKSE